MTEGRVLSEAHPHVCADPGACTLPACNEPPRPVLCRRCGSTGPANWCSWCDKPVQT
jgi:hypothetical protein